MSKPMNKQERFYAGQVAELGCIACRSMGIPDSPAELHHIRHGMGMGERNDHSMIIPLCYQHHRGSEGFHTSPRKFQAMFGTEVELLEKVRRLLK